MRSFVPCPPRCMRLVRPLPDTHPEFTVFYWPGFTEYRVEHWRLARDGSGRIVRGTCMWSCVEVSLVVLGMILMQCEVTVSRPVLFVGVGIVLTCVVWTRFTQVLHESLLVFPTLGIQLETHRGHPLLSTLSTTHHFIPLSALEDVIIHEGFRRWNVRYYLAALRRTRRGAVAHELSTAASGAVADASPGSGPQSVGSGRIEVRVAFEHILPYFPVLKEVYLGVQETLFSPSTGVVESVELESWGNG